MNWLKRNDLGVFLLLVFGLSCGPATHSDESQQHSDDTLGPMVAVFIVLGLRRCWTGARSLLAGMFRWRSAHAGMPLPSCCRL